MKCQWGYCPEISQYVIHYPIAGERYYCKRHAQIHIDKNPDISYTILSRDSQKGHMSEIHQDKRSF